MKLSRRSFIHHAATVPLVGSLPTLVSADLRFGEASITTVSDGHLILPGSLLFDAMPEVELQGILSAYGVSASQLAPECNLTLYRDGRNTVLFDAGSGADFMPSAGKVLSALETQGLAPEDITHVIFTHAHPDHIWGVLDEFDDPLFAGATHMMGRSEWDYWWDPQTATTIDDARVPFAVGARRRMQAIEESVVLFDDHEEILPGIAAVATPGHTPGHMAFEIRHGTEAVLVAGDAIGNHHVAFHRPEWHGGLDQDPATAAASRHMLLDRLTSEQMTLVGFHLPGGGIGRAERTEDGYRFANL
ncbi:MAG: MBL fold metallo-hydrolase [Alphaproteobacteria bacterium MedPE-SWcel]|nr:MAG: MBL fold metallo-hydrolase [Alphaproteobacteria bacterium MedPE-SWcel]